MQKNFLYMDSKVGCLPSQLKLFKYDGQYWKREIDDELSEFDVYSSTSCIVSTRY